MTLMIGYGRVSSDDQSLEIQEEKLRAYGCQRVLMEKVSGASLDGRDALKLALGILGKGDVLVVTRTDRLGRNVLDQCLTVKAIEDKGAGILAIDEGIDTRTEIGRFYFHLMSVIAEQERRRIRARQREGIDKAKAKGVYKGRSRAITADLVRPLKVKGLGPTAIARELGCSRMTVYRTGEFAARAS